MAEKKKTKEEILFPEPIEVTVGYGKEKRSYEVMPLVRKKYKKMFKVVGSVVKDLALQEEVGEEAIDLDNLGGSIPQILETAGDKLGEIYSMVLGEDLEWLEDHMLPSQEMDIIVAIFEQNDLADIVKNFKKMAAKIKIGESLRQLSSKKSVGNIK